jgi:flagellar hook assembly protein FlgD
MDIYNVRGQLVKTLLNQEMLAGTHSVIWDGKDGQGRSVSSGVYLYRMTMPNKVLTNKMLLLK